MTDVEKGLRDRQYEGHRRDQSDRKHRALEARGAQMLAVEFVDHRHGASYPKTKPRRRAGLQVFVNAGGLGAARAQFAPDQRAPVISATPEPERMSTSLVSRRKIAPTTRVITATTIGYQRPA